MGNQITMRKCEIESSYNDIKKIINYVLFLMDKFIIKTMLLLIIGGF